MYCLKSWHFKIWPVKNLWHFKKADLRILAFFRLDFKCLYGKLKLKPSLHFTVGQYFAEFRQVSHLFAAKPSTLNKTIYVPHECNIKKTLLWVNLKHNFGKKFFFQIFPLKFGCDLAELLQTLIFEFYIELYPKCDERQGKVFTVVLPTTLSCFPTIFWVHSTCCCLRIAYFR